jgi:hypothetical protein
VTIVIGGASWATDTETERVDCPGSFVGDTCSGCDRTVDEIALDDLDFAAPPCQNISHARRRA